MRRFCMTHLLAVVVILCSFQFARAATVLLSEGFDDVPNLPVTDWHQINNSNPLGLTDWFQGDETLFPAQAGALPNSYVAANYDNTGANGTISNWLITPVLDFAAVGQITFWTRALDPLPPPDPTYPDRLQVRLSTAGTSTSVGTTETDVGDFSTVLVEINPTLTVSDYPFVWTQYTIPSASLPASGSGRLAFRYYVTDAGALGTNSDYIGIDTFEVLAKTYTLTYTAGANGSISGTTPQTVDHGADGTAVTAVADSGYHFVNWSDGSTANPRTDTNVTANITVTANFAVDTAIQLLSEGFDDVANLPVTDWHQFNNSSPLGLTDWFQGDETLFPAQAGALPNSYVAANYDNTGDNGTISNWLLSPVLNFGSVGKITFWTRAVDPLPPPDPTYPDRMQVRLSTAGTSTNVGTAATDVGDFTTVLVEINPTLTVTDYPFVWTRYEITSASLPASGTGRVAFRYYVTDAGALGTNSDYIGVDTFEVLSKNDYTLKYTAGANGSITGVTPQTVLPGADGSAVTAEPALNYHFVNWSDGSTANPRTDTNVLTDISVTANFAIDTYTITATAGLNGTISPSGAVSVNHGSNQGFTITPAANYHVADVLVDGVSEGAVTSYTFNNVTAAHTIAASFAINTYTITATAGVNGSITPSGAVSVNHGSSQGFTITPAANYHVADVEVDEVSVGAVSSYTFTNVTAAHTIQVTFAIDTYTITASTGANGSITPSGAVSVNYDSSQGFTITPAANYHVADVLVDGVSVGAVTSYTFTNVTAAHTIAASFAINTYTITASAGANGSITPSGAVSVNHGSSQGFTITPAANYHVADVLVDGVSVGAVTNYTFTNVITTHTIAASFAMDTQTLTVQLTGNGKGRVTSDPAGIDCQGDCAENYDYGTVVTLTAVPEAGTTFKGWSGDCSGKDATCTVTMDQARNVTASFNSFPWNLFLPAILNPAPTP